MLLKKIQHPKYSYHTDISYDSIFINYQSYTKDKVFVQLLLYHIKAPFLTTKAKYLMIIFHLKFGIPLLLRIVQAF